MTNQIPVRGLDPEGGVDGQVPVISGGKFVIGDAPGAGDGRLLSPDAQISATKSTSNPTLNQAGALPENIIKVGTTYWLVYCHPNADYTNIDVRVASSSSPAGPWTPYGSNPILTTGSQAWEYANAANGACIVENDGTFYLYYGVEQGPAGTVAGVGVATATSVTGPYTKYASNPVLSPGTAGAWDSLRTHEPSVILVNGTSVMAYMGEDADFAKNTSEQVGIATATSPLGPWTKVDPANPQIPMGAAGSFDAGCVADPSLLYEDGIYYCIYSAIHVANGTPWVIGLASAPAPAGPWTKHPSNPILSVGQSGAFDSYGVFRGAVFRDGNTYHLPYAGVPSAGETSQALGGNAVLNITGGKNTAGSNPISQDAADARYVRSVNGVAPDGSGDVTVAAGATSTTALVPLTTVVGGVPELVWEADDSLALTEVPL